MSKKFQNSQNTARPFGTKRPAKGDPSPVVVDSSAPAKEPNATDRQATTSVVDFASSSGVFSSKLETVNLVSGEKTMQITLTRSTKVTKSKAIRFVSSQLTGTVRFPASAFDTVPDTLVIDGEGFATGSGKVAKSQMTKEEQVAARTAEKARVAALTPEQRIAETNAKLQKRSEKLAKQTAAVNARLAAVSAGAGA